MGWLRIPLPTDAAQFAASAERGRLLAHLLDTESNVDDLLDPTIAVPIEVWEYRLGGYQVLKKWLSYRESKVMGRGLEVSEVAWWSEVARRIAGILGVPGVIEC